jgi:hypothetical protein
VLYFRKLGQQRKTVNENEGSRPAKYSKSRESTLSFDTTHKHVHSIDSDVCGPPKNWEKNSDLHGWKVRAEHTTPEEITTTQEAVIQIKAKVASRPGQTSVLYVS